MRNDKTLEQIREDSNWRTILGPDDFQPIENFPYSLNDVVEVIANRTGENDYNDWLGLFRMVDGKCVYVAAGCDYTGWDCQAGGSFLVFDSLDQALSPLGVPRDERQYLGIEADSKKDE